VSLKIAHVIQSIDPRFGGPSAVVMRLARAQANLGAKVSIVTVSSDNERRCFDDWMTQMGQPVNLELVMWPGGWIRNLRVGSEVHELLQRLDIVHLHGVWDSLVARCLLARAPGDACIVLAPHGMLSPWSMRQKKAKKKLVWNLWMRSALSRVDRFHVLNASEGLELHALLPHASIGVLPNGTDLPHEQGPGITDKPYILFLARLHVMKGPDRLIDAFASGVKSGSLPRELGLVIAGPDFGMLSELRLRVARLGIADRVTFTGAVFGAEKAALLDGAVALCQPSRHEGFSLTLLESLAHGVPVVTTPESNLPPILAADCGFVVDGDDITALSASLSRVVVDRELRDRMSHAGRVLVSRHYTWEKVAEQALQLYGQCSGTESAADDVDRFSAARTG